MMRNIKLINTEGHTEIKLFLNDYMVENNVWLGLDFDIAPTMTDVLSKDIVSENIQNDPDMGCVKVVACSSKEEKSYFYDLNNDILELIDSKEYDDELDIYDLLEDGSLYADSKTRAVIEMVLLILSMTILILFLRADYIENVTLYIMMTSMIMLIILFDLIKEKIGKWLKNIMQ